MLQRTVLSLKVFLLYHDLEATFAIPPYNPFHMVSNSPPQYQPDVKFLNLPHSHRLPDV